MTICRECGVELDDKMRVCPLCDTPVQDQIPRPVARERHGKTNMPDVRKKSLLSQVLWQIVAILLISGIAATMIINVAIQGTITWSIYPISICLMLLSYVTLLSLWRTKITYQLAGGWILSSIVLLIVDALIATDWPLRLGLPILCSLNILVFVLIVVSRALTTRGLNLFAIIILGIAVFCIVIEGIITSYFGDRISLQWSAIVSACLLPVSATILFMYFRTRNNSELKKIFHT